MQPVDSDAHGENERRKDAVEQGQGILWQEIGLSEYRKLKGSACRTMRLQDFAPQYWRYFVAVSPAQNEDTARLDWLEENWTGADVTLVFNENGTELREAIDAAGGVQPAAQDRTGEIIEIDEQGKVHDTIIVTPAAQQRREVPYAWCCNTDPSGCDCVNKDHGTAFIELPAAQEGAPAAEKITGITLTRCTTGDNCWMDEAGKHHHLVAPSPAQEKPETSELIEAAVKLLEFYDHIGTVSPIRVKVLRDALAATASPEEKE